MPTYVYKFIETGETIEVQQSFSDDALTEAVHPTSGETMAVKKVFLPVGITFKGGGFYKTDSRSGASKPSAATPSPSTPTATSESVAARAADTSSNVPSMFPHTSSNTSPNTSSKNSGSSTSD